MTEEPRTSGGRAAASGRRLPARAPWAAAAATLALAVALVVPGTSGARPAVAADYAPDGAPAAVPAAVPPSAPPAWVRTWQAAPQPPSGTLLVPGPQAVTVRMRIHTSLGGRALRLTLSNRYGLTPLGIAAVSVARPDKVTGASVAAAPGTLQLATFSGLTATTVPAGGVVVSDVVTADVPSHGDLLVSVAYSTRPQGLTGHATSVATSRLALDGDRTTDLASKGFTTSFVAWPTLSAVDVVPSDGAPVPALVAFGDSITDGTRSTRDADRRWPDALADMVPGVAVVNAGIGRNRLLVASPEGGEAAPERFGRDVLDVPGVKVVAILEGVNDVREGASEAAVVAGLTDLGRRARARGLVVVLATLTPFGRPGATVVGDRERVRVRVNAWIRDEAVRAGAADAVVDVAGALQSTGDPHALAPLFDSGDHLHPSDAGYATVAATFEPAVRSLLARS